VLRAQLRDLDAKIEGRNDVNVNLEDVKRKLAGFEGKQHAEKLKAYQLRSRQNRELDRQLRHVDEIAGQLLEKARELSTDDAPQGLFDPRDATDQEAIAAIERLHAAVSEAVSAVLEAGERLAAVEKRERAGLATGAWHAAFGEAANAYTELTGELKEQGVADPSEYGKLVQDRQRLEGELSRMDSLQMERDKLVAEATSQRQRVREARRTLSKARQDFLSSTLGACRR
jgi:hypothetical protein